MCVGVLLNVCVQMSMYVCVCVYAQILSGQRTLLGVVIWVSLSF